MKTTPFEMVFIIRGFYEETDGTGTGAVPAADGLRR